MKKAEVNIENKWVKGLKKKIAALVGCMKFGSIQFIISSAIMVITASAMIFVGFTFYGKFTKTAEQNAAINTRQIIDQVNMNLDFYLRSMMDISDSLKHIIYYSGDIDSSKLKEQMEVILGTRKDIVNMAVFSDKGELVVGVPSYKVKKRANISGQDWFKAPIEKPENFFYSSPHVQNIYESQHSWVVSLSRGITFDRGGKKVQGVLLVDMNFSSIDQLCQKVKLGNKGYIYIIDSRGNVVYHPQQQLINMGLKTENVQAVLEHVFGRFFDKYNGERRLITVDPVNYCRWRIVGIAYLDETIATKKELSSFIGWTLILGIFFVIFVSAFISAKISQPIKKLEKSMKMVEEGHFDININVSGEDEVVKLSRAFNLMVSKVRQLMEQIVVEQEAKRKSELNALQAQINPHFLYNTLDSIVWMAENGKSRDVIIMVTALARLFRISISRGRNIITVREELEHARNYLIIQKIRYKNKFRFELEVQEDTLECMTLKLILQPIIENSIYHGIEYMVDEALIKISAAFVEGKLLLKVEDNGLGMKPEILKNLLSYETRNKESSGVGVKNVHERIQLLYGKEYGLEVESRLEEGTTVNIWLPVIVGSEDRGVSNENIKSTV